MNDTNYCIFTNDDMWLSLGFRFYFNITFNLISLSTYISITCSDVDNTNNERFTLEFNFEDTLSRNCNNCYKCLRTIITHSHYWWDILTSPQNNGISRQEICLLVSVHPCFSPSNTSFMNILVCIFWAVVILVILMHILL